MIARVDKVFTGICLVAAFFALAGFLHDPTRGEPSGWIIAFGLALGVVVAGASILALIVRLSIRIYRGPARSFLLRKDGVVVVAVFGHLPVWGKLLSLSSAETSVVGAKRFSLLADGRGLSFRRSGPRSDEIAFLGWSRIVSVVPTVIEYRSRTSNGISVTAAGPDGNSSIDFTCARMGATNIYGRQSWGELQELCLRISAQSTDAENAR